MKNRLGPKTIHKMLVDAHQDNTNILIVDVPVVIHPDHHNDYHNRKVIECTQGAYNDAETFFKYIDLQSNFGRVVVVSNTQYLESHTLTYNSEAYLSYTYGVFVARVWYENELRASGYNKEINRMFERGGYYEDGTLRDPKSTIMTTSAKFYNKPRLSITTPITSFNNYKETYVVDTFTKKAEYGHKVEIPSHVTDTESITIDGYVATFDGEVTRLEGMNIPTITYKDGMVMRVGE